MKKRYARILAATLSAAMVFTSAPTAVYATELSVSEDAVEAEGMSGIIVEESDIESLFPTKLTSEFGTGLVKDGAALYLSTGANAASGAVGATSYVGTAKLDFDTEALKKIDAGKTSEVSVIYTPTSVAESTHDFSKIAGYKKTAVASGGNVSGDATANITITKKIPVEIVKSKAFNSGAASELDTTNLATVAATSAYGSGKVDLALVNGAAYETWVVKSVDAKVALAKAGDTVAGGAVIETKKTYNFANYEKPVADVLQALNFEEGQKVYSFNSSTGKFEKKVDVVISNTQLTKIEWPVELAAGQKVTVGDKLTSIKLANTATSAYGTFAVTNEKAYGAGTYSNATTVQQSGKTDLQVTFTPDANIDVATGVSTTGRIVVMADKKTINVSDIATTLVTTEFPKKTGGSTTDWDDVIDHVTSFTSSDTTNLKKLVDGLTYTFTNKDLSYGKNELEITATPSADYKLSNGASNYKFKVTCDVKTAKVVSDVEYDITTGGTSVNSYASAGYMNVPASTDADNYTTLKAVLADVENGSDFTLSAGAGSVDGITLSATYQWHKIEGAVDTAIKDAINETYKIPVVSTKGTIKYYCEVKVSAGTGLSEQEIEDVKAVIGDGTYKTPEAMVVNSAIVLAKNSTVVFGKTDLGSDLNNSGAGTTVDSNNVDYGAYEKVVSKIQYTLPSGFELKSSGIVAYVLDSKGNKTAIPGDNIERETNASKKYAMVTINKGLDADVYTLVVEFTATKDSETDTAVYTEKFTVDQNEKPLNLSTLVTLAKKEYSYGTKLSDVKFTADTKYGTITLDSASVGKKDYITVSSPNETLNFKFEPTDAVKKNYKEGSGKAYEKTFTKTVGVTKAELVVAAKDIEIKVNDEMPSVKNVTEVVTGLVAGDTLDDLLTAASVRVTYQIDKTKVDVTKAGEYKDALIVGFSGAFNPTNYDVTLKTGSVIVVDPNAKPSTPPTVAPTPAPVKQAVAAAPKAAKAKATVKVGKKYTLKLKYAAGKKATVKKVKWTSSKKSVATVSSKGKVTAKKAGKATIYARVYFKDGSMKKVKFTVTVK